MYAPYFGLRQEPFSIAPDPRYLFMSERHREALAHLLYGLGGGGGFVLLTGEVGAGKTTVCRCFLEQVPRRCNVAYIFNPKLSALELLKTVCDEFRVPAPPDRNAAPPTVKGYLDPLNEFLLKTHGVGQDNVLIIDEAQNLGPEVLEQLRLLTNLETNEKKLLQIILIGQPELRDMLARPELEQLAQRVIARFHLGALSETETAQYVAHRLGVAGLGAAQPFDARALKRVHALSRGIPRRINLLCDRALLGAYATGQARVDRRIVDRAAREVFGPGAPAAAVDSTRGRLVFVGLGLAVGAVLAGVAAVTLAPGRSTGALSVAAASRGGASSASGASDRARAAGVAALSSSGAGLAASASAAASDAAAVPEDLTAATLQTRFPSPLRSERDGWRELAPLWNLPASAGDPCEAAEREQVHCFRSAGTTLALIRELGRPGLVALRDGNDQPVYALLTGLGPASATLRMGDAVRTVSLASLAQLWRGDFATYWRVPPGYEKRVVSDDSDALADWLSEQLTRVETPAPAAGTPLKTRVVTFQLAHGLKADGLAGPTTFMQLNRATGVGEPRLAIAPPAP